MSALTEQAALYAAERAPECGEYVTLQRAYMAGALAALKREAHTWRKAAETYAAGLNPFDFRAALPASATVLGLNGVDKQKLEEARQLAMSMTSHPVAFGTIEHTERAGELLAELVHALDQKHAEYEDLKECAANNARNLAREAHTWWTAARDAMKLREPLAPEVIEAAAAEAFGYEGGLQEVNLGDLLHFARVLERRHGIGA